MCHIWYTLKIAASFENDISNFYTAIFYYWLFIIEGKEVVYYNFRLY